MAREINLNSFGNHYGEQLSRVVKEATLEWEAKVKLATPVVSGNLRGSWDNDIEKFRGEVFTDVEYAEPVAFGTNLPPSWGGSYKTRQQTVKGYPELIGKQIATDIRNRINL